MKFLDRCKRPLALLLAICVSVMSLSCTGYVRMPADEYEEIPKVKTERWRIRTETKDTYIATRISLTDSTVVIEAFDPGATRPAVARHIPDGAPYVLDREDVTSIDRYDQMGFAQTLLVSGFLVALGLILIAAWVVAPNMGSWD